MAPKIFYRVSNVSFFDDRRGKKTIIRWVYVRQEEEAEEAERTLLTTHTSCLGGFCGPGGSQLAGNWSLESDDHDDEEASDCLPSFSIAAVVVRRNGAAAFWEQRRFSQGNEAAAFNPKL